MHYETGMTPSSPQAMKMDSRGIFEAKSAPMEGSDGWRRLRSATLCRASLRYGGERVSERGRKNHRKA
jgi:hypothetical protein